MNREPQVQTHLKKVYSTLAMSVLSAGVGGYVHLYTSLSNVIVSKNHQKDCFILSLFSYIRVDSWISSWWQVYSLHCIQHRIMERIKRCVWIIYWVFHFFPVLALVHWLNIHYTSIQASYRLHWWQQHWYLHVSLSQLSMVIVVKHCFMEVSCSPVYHY